MCVECLQWIWIQLLCGFLPESGCSRNMGKTMCINSCSKRRMVDKCIEHSHDASSMWLILKQFSPIETRSFHIHQVADTQTHTHTHSHTHTKSLLFIRINHICHAANPTNIPRRSIHSYANILFSKPHRLCVESSSDLRYFNGMLAFLCSSEWKEWVSGALSQI